MRFVLYNIRYGTGVRALNFLGPSGQNLSRIESFLRELEPDLVGLVEVDHGSYRSGGRNQAETLADALGHHHSHCVKYKEDSLWRRMPVLRKQGNAFLTRERIRHETFHYFESGMKRLVIEVELDHVQLFLVHLALGARVRHQQLNSLYRMVKDAKKPCLVAGDFNALWGDREIDLFLAATGLKSANVQGAPTYPSSKPRRHLDFILHGDEISVRDFQVPQVRCSDHLPLVMDFDVRVSMDRRWEACPPRKSIRQAVRDFQRRDHTPPLSADPLASS